MNQYSMLLTSQEYADFIRENAAYAKLMGYNVAAKHGLTEAMSDQFLFQEFMNEVEVM
jgi:pyridoxine 5'-phosphate synthase PdxJ